MSDLRAGNLHGLLDVGKERHLDYRHSYLRGIQQGSLPYTGMNTFLAFTMTHSLPAGREGNSSLPHLLSSRPVPHARRLFFLQGPASAPLLLLLLLDPLYLLPLLSSHSVPSSQDPTNEYLLVTAQTGCASLPSLFSLRHDFICVTSRWVALEALMAIR
mmetsp:Transcript_4371/g.15972  ORF Transcript_4371/g.15972 Transcript_4371/m.15972 type:complete len:159 (+) Transcript_4371:831-1307(+)